MPIEPASARRMLRWDVVAATQQDAAAAIWAVVLG